MPPPRRVLISGAGIAGPTVAYFLAKNGAQEITILERHQNFRAQGQSVDFCGAGVTVLQKMGIFEEVKRRNTTENGSAIEDERGRVVAWFPVTGNGSPSSEYEILRGDLAELLYDTTKDLPNVRYEFSKFVTEVLSDGDNDYDDDDDGTPVKVRFNDGTQAEYDLLIAADGQYSKIRRQVFPARDTTMVDTNMYLAFFTIPKTASDNAAWRICLTLGRRGLSLRPDTHGTARAMLSKFPATPEEKKTWDAAARAGRDAQMALLRAEFGQQSQKTQGMTTGTAPLWQAERLLQGMEGADDFYFSHLEQVKMGKWSKGRVVCLGDAAYCPTPMCGIGTLLAVVGAHNLAGELSRLGDREHPRRALDAYEEGWRPFVEQSQQILPGFPGVLHPATPLSRWALRTTFWMLSKVLNLPFVPYLKTWLPQRHEETYVLPEYDFGATTTTTKYYK